MPCTTAKLHANRHNATKSTGPQTTAGKARSSRNALKHGFCASASSLAPLEDREAYDAFTASIRDSLRPATPMEQDLAHRIADLSWRLRRIPDAEAALLTRAASDDLALKGIRAAAAAAAAAVRPDDTAQTDEDDNARGDDLFPDSPARHLASAMSLPQNPYLTLQRYEQSLDRARSRALKDLRQLQTDHRREQQDEAKAPPRRNEPTPPTEDLTPSPSQREGRGEGEPPAHAQPRYETNPTPPL